MVMLGIDRLFTEFISVIRGRRIGLLTHYAMTDSTLTPVIDRFLANVPDQLVALFGPEHGVQNGAREGEPVPYQIDPHSLRPAYSLYGAHQMPTLEMLSGIDLVIIDLQDIGSRYYTNISTVYYCLKASALYGVPLVLLDRPNPINGVQREGYPLDLRYQSFVGIAALPTRHGLTLGEIARWMTRLYWPKASLEVIPLAGWRREMFWQDTEIPFVSPSPNTTGPTMALLYPGTCLFEGTNISVGRGTVHPFEWLGAPWVDGHQWADGINQRSITGLIARPVYFVPARPPYSGELCQGVQLHVTDPTVFHSMRAGVAALEVLYALYPEMLAFPLSSDGVPFFDRLAGGFLLREAILNGGVEHYWGGEAEAVAAFDASIQTDLLY